MKNKKLFSTGEIARRYSLTRDTVLKWIKKGRIPAIKTAGGHYRVTEEDLQRFDEELSSEKKDSPRPFNYMYCWEVMAREGKDIAKCQQCIAYRSKSERCFELVELETEHKKLYCETSCQDCSYYHRRMESATNLLVITDNSKLREALTASIDNGKLALNFSESEFESLVMIGDLKPEFVLLDYSLLKRRT